MPQRNFEKLSVAENRGNFKIIAILYTIAITMKIDTITLSHQLAKQPDG